MKLLAAFLTLLLPLTILAQWQEHPISKSLLTSSNFLTDDFDGDGDNDFLSHNVNTGEVYILENMGNGRIAENIIAVQNLRNVSLGGGQYDEYFSLNLNGDALPDFVMSFVEDTNTQHNIYFENLGSFQFTLVDTLLSLDESSPYSLVVNDNNQDGYDDIMLTYRQQISQGGYEAKVLSYTNLLNNNFQSQNVYTGFAKAILTDREGDGDIDFFTDTLWYRNDISSFAPLTNQATYFGFPFTTDFTYSDLIIEDFNNDGWADAIELGTYFGDSMELYFTPGTASNTFDWALRDTSMVLFAEKLTVFDVDNNGIKEFYGQLDNPQIKSIVYQFNGVSEFTSSILFSHPETDYSDWMHQTLNDFNNDGVPDLVIPSKTYSNFFYLEGLGNFQYSQQPISLLNMNISTSFIQLVDLDNDQTLELITSSQQAGIFSTYENEASTIVDQRVRWSQLEFGSHPRCSEAIDFNNDNAKDIAFVSSSSSYLDYGIELIPNQNGLFYGAPVVIADSLDEVFKLVALDYNSDGLEDLLTAERTANAQGVQIMGIYLYTNNGNNSFQKSILIEEQYMIPLVIWDFVVGDIDNDNDIDIILTHETISEPILYRNTSNGFISNTLYMPFLSVSGAAAQFLDLTDIDGDSDLDLLIRFVSMDPLENTVYSYLNLGNGQFGMEAFIDYSYTSSIKHGDYDNDGDIDIIFSDLNGSLNWYMNPGTGLFNSNILDWIANSVELFDIGRINSDQFIDVAVLKPDKTLMSWYEADPGVLSVTNLNPIDQTDFKPFPNPSSGAFYIPNVPTNSTIQLLDLHGKQLEVQTESMGNHLKIDVINPSPGMYLLQVHQEDTTVTKQLIIQ